MTPDNPLSLSLSRRQFLVVLAGAAAGAMGVGVPVVWHTVSQARDLPLPDTYTGSLDPAARRALVALVDALFIDHPVDDLERYGRYFDFHAEHIPGYQTLYHNFVADVNRLARPAYGLDFADCKVHPRRDVIKPWFDLPEQREERVMAAAFKGVPWLLYAHYIFREILMVFMHSDAWLMVGYATYPGVPRGLETYRQPPAQATLSEV